MLGEHVQSPIVARTLTHTLSSYASTWNVLLWCGAGLVTRSLIFSFPGSAEGLGSLVSSELGQVVMKIDVQLLCRGGLSKESLIQKYRGVTR